MHEFNRLVGPLEHLNCFSHEFYTYTQGPRILHLVLLVHVDGCDGPERGRAQWVEQNHQDFGW